LKDWQRPFALRERAEKIRKIPASFGVDEGDAAFLEEIADTLEIQEVFDESPPWDED
jgi:hypothetical protein